MYQSVTDTAVKLLLSSETKADEAPPLRAGFIGEVDKALS